MSFGCLDYRDQGVHGGPQPWSLNRQPSWDAGLQALKISTSSASTSNSKPEGFMSPYGVYDMNDGSFFAHATRLNIIIGSNIISTQFLRPSSSSTE